MQHLLKIFNTPAADRWEEPPCQVLRDKALRMMTDDGISAEQVAIILRLNINLVRELLDNWRIDNAGLVK